MERKTTCHYVYLHRKSFLVRLTQVLYLKIFLSRLFTTISRRNSWFTLENWVLSLQLFGSIRLNNLQNSIVYSSFCANACKTNYLVMSKLYLTWISVRILWIPLLTFYFYGDFTNPFQFILHCHDRIYICACTMLPLYVLTE